jgi:hypothetical protein
MFNDLKGYEKIDTVIDRVLDEMSATEPGTKAYTAMSGQLNQLYRVKELDLNLKIKVIETDAKQKEHELNCQAKETEIALKKEEIKSHYRVKPDTLALIAGNLAGILIVVGYEHTHIVASKAFSLLNRIK